LNQQIWRQLLLLLQYPALNLEPQIVRIYVSLPSSTFIPEWSLIYVAAHLFHSQMDEPLPKHGPGRPRKVVDPTRLVPLKRRVGHPRKDIPHFGQAISEDETVSLCYS
jgi:hypothetical protein